MMQEYGQIDAFHPINICEIKKGLKEKKFNFNRPLDYSEITASTLWTGIDCILQIILQHQNPDSDESFKIIQEITKQTSKSKYWNYGWFDQFLLKNSIWKKSFRIVKFLFTLDGVVSETLYFSITGLSLRLYKMHNLTIYQEMAMFLKEQHEKKYKGLEQQWLNQIEIFKKTMSKKLGYNFERGYEKWL